MDVSHYPLLLTLIFGVAVFTHSAKAALFSQFRAERQSAQMSQITNDSLTQSGTGCFIAVPTTHMATVGIKGLMSETSYNY